MPLTTFARIGYYFTDWNTEAHGLGRSFYDDEIFNIDTATTLYAQWAPISYTVEFNGNGSTSGEVSERFLFFAVDYLTVNSYSRTGYIFICWNTVSDGSGDSFEDVALYTLPRDSTLYAQWVAFTHAVTFDGNSSSSGEMAPQELICDAILTTNFFHREGYQFAGWNSSPDGIGDNVDDASNYRLTKSATLYVQWVATP